MGKDVLRKLKRIGAEEIEIIWHKEWFDGPLNGVARYQNKFYWFETQGLAEGFDLPDAQGSDDQVYFLFLLKKNELAEANEWNRKNKIWKKEWTNKHFLNKSQAEKDKFRADWEKDLGEWESPELDKKKPACWFLDDDRAQFYSIKLAEPDKIYREENGKRVEGFLMYAFIQEKNMYPLVALKIYSDSRIDCGGMMTFKDFKQQVHSGRISTNPPNGAKITLPYLGLLTVKDPFFVLEPTDLIHQVEETLTQLQQK